LKIGINPEYASQVPPLTTEEYNSVKQSIKENGLYYPIIVNQDGIILDGHHRHKICTELGIEPQYIVRNFKDKLREKLFVLETNLERRHLNKFQRTELSLRTKPILEEIAKRNESLGGKGVKDLTPLVSRVNQKVGELAGVSHETVRKVEKIIECLQPNELDIVRRGEISIDHAYKTILLTKNIRKVGEELSLNLKKLAPEFEKVDDEIERLQKSLSDASLRIQREEVAREYSQKVRESNRLESRFQLLCCKANLKIISLLKRISDPESEIIKLINEIERIEDSVFLKEGKASDISEPGAEHKK
jgi:ParB-like chromosome segregation protein Spo0J